MRGVDKGFEFLRSTEPGAQGEEIRHLVAERAVIRVLLESHYLDRVVPQIFDPRQDIPTELTECGDFRLLGTHPYVTLVDQRMRPAQHFVMFPLVGLRRIPDLGAENFGLRVLDKPPAICGDPFAPASRPLDEQLVQVAMTEEKPIKAQFPVAFPRHFELVSGGSFPIVEIPDKVDPRSVRGPFPDHPRPVGFFVEPVVQMVVDPGRQTAARWYNLVPGSENPLVAGLYGVLVRLKPRVRLIYFLDFTHSFTIYEKYTSGCPLGSGFVEKDEKD